MFFICLGYLLKILFVVCGGRFGFEFLWFLISFEFLVFCCCVEIRLMVGRFVFFPFILLISSVLLTGGCSLIPKFFGGVGASKSSSILYESCITSDFGFKGVIDSMC